MIPCPICCGLQTVTVSNIQGREWLFPCEYCKNGNGQVPDEWTFFPQVTKIRIDGIETNSTEKGTQIRYKFNWSSCGGNLVDAEKCRDSEIEAQVEAMRLAATAIEEAAKPKNPSGDMGYHAKALLDYAESMEHSQRMIDFHRRALGV
jgi:hypothetical protein